MSGIGVLSLGVALVDVGAAILSALSPQVSMGRDEAVFADTSTRSRIV